MTGERRIGSVIADRYRLDGVLGRGGMSIVYRATHTLTQREVALKLLEFTEAADQDSFARFLREAQSAVKLQHPHVVEVLDMGKLEDGSLYLALELLRGRTLADVLREKRRLTSQEVLEMLLPIMDAMAAAHRVGLVHRDLKPANIFLHETGERTVPKLLDFGIVKQLGASMSTTKVGQIIGTPYFMAPEQAEGREVGPAADVWSMAVVLYAALSGKLPFKGPHHFAVMMAISAGEHLPLHDAAPSIPRALADVIESALMVEPEGRPRDMAALSAALVACAERIDSPLDAALDADTEDDHQAPPPPTELDSHDIPSLHSKTRPSPSQEARRSPAVASAVVALLVAGVAVAGYQRLQEPVEAPVIETVAGNLVPPPADPIPAPLPAPLASPPPPAPQPAAVAPVEDDALKARDAAYAVQHELDLLRCPPDIMDSDEAVRLRGKWSVADEMYAQGEKQVALSYYRELKEITKGLLEMCRAAPPQPPSTPPPPPSSSAPAPPPPPPSPSVVADSATPQSNVGPAKQKYQRAMQLKEKGSIDRAIAELDGAIKLAPDFVAALNSRGLLHQQRGKVNAALADFDAALAVQDDNATIHYNRAQARITKRDSFGALADMDRAIELAPKTPLYFESRAGVHTLRDRPDLAEADLARAIALDPSRLDLRLRRARTLVAIRKYTEAVGELSELIEVKPTAEAYYLRGTAQYERKKLDEAIKDFTETLTREPTHERALLQRGIARAMLEDKKEAIADLEKFLVLAPTSKHRGLAERSLARLRR